MSPKIPKIHKNMVVGEVVSMFPEAADIISSYGLHCVGCHANAFETLEQGLLGHGYPEEQLHKLVGELNEYIEELNAEAPKKLPAKSKQMKVSVTPFALKKIQEIAKKQERKNIFLRVEVRRAGDTYKYTLNFIDESEKQDSEKIFNFAKGKVHIVADQWDHEKLHGLKIDYVVEEDREGFKMKNPNVA